jgi:hypothetical protein
LAAADFDRPRWFIYMQDTLTFPFKAEILIKKRSGEKVKQKVDVLALAGDENFGRDMVVEVAYTEDIILAPLSELQHIKANEEVKEAIEDWKYWKSRYRFL